MRDWVDLHHHSGFSLLDGYGSAEDHVKRAKELGHPAVAFTEHGTARGFVALHEAAKAEGIRPIYGLEFYVCRDHRVAGLSEEQKASVTAGLERADEKREAVSGLEAALGIRERRHLVVIADSDEGIRNILRLNNRANTEGYYYKPRIDIPLLLEHRDGLWASSACLGGVLAKSFIEGDTDRLVDDALQLHEGLEGRFSLELQPHPIGLQARWNKVALHLHEELGIPIIVTNDSHYIKPEDWHVHDALITLGHGKLLSDPDRIKYVQESFAIKGPEDVVEAFARNHPDIPRAKVVEGMQRAAGIASVCSGDLRPPKGVLLPDLAPAGSTATEELRELCLDGWAWREMDDRPARTGHPRATYLARLKHELDVIAGMAFDPYFLLIEDLIRWARAQGITIGPGRGSGAGSLVLYLLGVTGLDPVEHGLLFERFLTPGRPDWPDVDIDVERNRRHEVFEYLIEKYGEAHVAQIGTINKMRGRSALRDVARVHGVASSEVDPVVSAIVGGIARDEGEGDSITEALASTPALQAFADRHPVVMQQTVALEGHIRHVGIHAAGVVVTPVPLEDLVPLERRKSGGESKVVIGYDMRDCEKVGLVKIDLLGLKYLSICADAVRLIERRTGTLIDLEKLPFDDPAVLQRFTDLDFAGVFQFDSASARAASRGVTFDAFTDVVTLNAINRPGPANSGLADEWRLRKRDGAPVGHPVVDAICADSLGVMVYQEHVIRIMQELAGFDPKLAGKLRKAISKSKGRAAIEEHRDEFVEGAMRNSMSELEADALWTSVGDFGKYGFNKSHAAAYSAIGYWCMGLKHYHPLEFFGALLMNESDAGAAGRFVREASRNGITIEPPDINDSARVWQVKGGKLLAGLAGVKGVGDRACEDLLRAQPFTSLGDLWARVNRRVVHRGVLDKLARAGALRSIVPNARWLCEHLPKLVKRVEKSKGWIAKVDGEVAAAASEPGWESEDEWAEQLLVGVHGRGEHPMGVLKTVDSEVLRRDWTPLSEAYTGALVRGVISSRKIGSSKGGRWASLEIEDEGGVKLRLRFNDASYTENRSVIDLGVGGLVAAHIAVNNDSARCVKLYDLLGIRSRWLAGEGLTDDDVLVCRELHPATEARGGKLAAPDWADRPGLTTCYVLRAKVVTARTSGRRMAFALFDAGVSLAREAVIFPDTWDSVRPLKAGDLVRVALTPDTTRGGYIVRTLVKL